MYIYPPFLASIIRSIFLGKSGWCVVALGQAVYIIMWCVSTWLFHLGQTLAHGILLFCNQNYYPCSIIIYQTPLVRESITYI